MSGLFQDLPVARRRPPRREAVRWGDWPFGELQPRSYGLIYADPPWAFETFSEAGKEKSPDRHYDCIPETELLQLPVARLAAPDCLMILWHMWCHNADQTAHRVMRGWGFQPKSGGSWGKRTKHGKIAFGTGYCGFRGACEPYLLGTIGSPTAARADQRNLIVTEEKGWDPIDAVEALDSFFLEAAVREHSRKPDEMREALDRLFPHVPKLELFARTRAPGWDAWGNQVDKFGDTP